MTLSTFRPSDVTGDWTNISSGSISDDSDSTAKLFTNSYQYGTARFNVTGLPFGSNIVIRWIKVRARVALSVTTVAYLQVTAFTGTGRALITIGDAYQLLVLGTSYVEVATGTRPVSFTAADGDIVVTLHPTSPVGANAPKVSEMYLDVDFAYPPLNTVNSPGNYLSTATYTTTSSPPLWFTYFSQEGYTQTAYRYLIYTAAQYGAAGFVPGVSAADYDSGVVYSSATKGVNVHARPNGTYRVYVSVAQTVNGALQWSPWNGQTNFGTYILNVAPPPAASVTATADNANARIILAVTGAGAANSVQDLYEVQRSFDGGVTWESVRSDMGGFIVNVGGARQWYDYETGNGQFAIYRARTYTYDTVGNTLVGAFGSNSASVAWTSTSSWLKITTRPDLNRTIVVRSFGREELDVPMGTFQGLGSGKIVTVSGVRRDNPDSTFVILSQTDQELAALKTILALGEPLLIHSSSRSNGWGGISKFLQVGPVQISRPTRAGWSALRDLTLPYSEVDRPDPDIYDVEFGVNTWQDIDDLFATFTAMNAAYATYGAIRG